MIEIIAMGALDLRFLQSKDDTAGGLDVFEMTLKPAARMPVAHYHDSWDETVYGLEGVSLWRIEGRDVALSPGESLFIRRGVVHGFSNATSSLATCLCILTPGRLGPGYFRDMAVLLRQDVPDPARMKAMMLRYGLVPATDGDGDRPPP